MVVKLIEYIKAGFTNQDGQIIFEKIMNAFCNKEKVEVSFEGIGGVSSSFVNTAFIQLLDYYEYSFIKENLKFSNMLKVNNDLIKKRFQFETENKSPKISNNQDNLSINNTDVLLHVKS